MQKYRISEIKCSISGDKDEILGKIEKKAKILRKDISSWEIVRESIDARDKKDIKKVYTVDFACNKKLKLTVAPDRRYKYPENTIERNKKIIITGFGPAGMFSGLVLAQMGYRPIIIERGEDVDTRTKDVQDFWNNGNLKENSNVQFGEGGAGTFSDGKLTTGINDSRIYFVLSEFCRFGAPEEIMYLHKPHIGTDRLKDVVKNLRKEIIKLGGEIRFGTKLEDIILNGNMISEVVVEKNGTKENLKCDALILTIGHSARDTFKMLYEKDISMEQKSFSMGVRIQHPQKLINEAQYGSNEIAEILGAADYKLNMRTKSGRGVYTFCMCPGGEVVMSSSSKGQLLTNGMSNYKRDGEYANSAVLVDLRKTDFESDHPLAGMKLQDKIESTAYNLSGKYELLTSNIRNFRNSKLAKCLPDFTVDGILEALPVFGRKIRGFDGEEAEIKGPETRSSSPVRFLRDEKLRSNIINLYPGGEGAGYAGGIMSAAVDGIKLAEAVVTREQK